MKPFNEYLAITDLVIEQLSLLMKLLTSYLVILVIVVIGRKLMSEIKMKATFEQRVEAGMIMLDELIPNWIDSINIDQLEKHGIWSFKACVLEQAFGNYTTGLLTMREKSEFYKHYTKVFGENSSPFACNIEDDEQLTAAWVRAIRDKRGN